MRYWILRAIATLIVKSIFKLKVEGFENLPKKTNFILVANHTSYLDPVVIGVAIPKKFYWITLREFYNTNFLRWVALKKETLPTGNSSDKAIDLLMKNESVGLFPEGGRSRDGKLREFRRGAALLAIKTGRPVVPCAIIGAYEALPGLEKLPKLFQLIKVKIGKPQYLLKEFEDVIDDIYLQEGIFKLRNTIKEMIYAG